MSFYRESKVKATRRAHSCYGCTRSIPAGEPALYIVGYDRDNGGIWHGHYHHDCRAAEIALNDLHDIRPGDDWMPLSDIDWEDQPWLEASYPNVAARVFWKATE